MMSVQKPCNGGAFDGVRLHVSAGDDFGMKRPLLALMLRPFIADARPSDRLRRNPLCVFSKAGTGVDAGKRRRGDALAARPG